jgi:adenine-specific DNA methylase
MKKWQDMFSTRQLLVHGTFVEEFRKIIPKIEEELNDDEANAVLSLLPIMGGKAVNINSMLSTWDTTRQKIRSVFDTHNFAFKWTFAEFEGAQELFTWLSGSLVGAYSGISNLLAFSGEDSLDAPDDVPPKSVPVVIHGSAANLQTIEDDSQTLVCIDPPYGDNVMYAELSDFFYVWEKRTLGKVNPDFFKEELTDKANEAVTNVARFADSGKRKKELANQDYEMKMTAIFDECHRVLADNGVLSIMFTHKDAAAWDNLGMSLMDAGFTIETSWPVPTESEQSLHQKGLNSAASTIMLVCRKRPERDATEVFFEDIEGDVRDAAREASARFEALGITGVDLMLSTYGPALSVVSNNWPVYSSEPDPITGASRLLKPEEALTTAREELTRIQRKRLVGRDVQFHPYTDFTILCWDLFGAPAFPFDEARRLALAVGGLDMNELAKDGKILEKKGGNVRLLSPSERLRRDADFDKGLSGVYPNASSLPPIGIDAVHTAMYIAEHDGPAAAKAWMDKVGAAGNPKFMGALQAMLNAVPRSKTKGEWNYPEAEQLDALAFYFDDLRVPEVDEPVAIEEPEQQSFELGD